MTMTAEEIKAHCNLREVSKHIRVDSLVRCRGQLCYVVDFDITKRAEEMPVTLTPVSRPPCIPIVVRLPEITDVLVAVEHLQYHPTSELNYKTIHP